MMESEISVSDRKLLNHLQENGRITNQELADAMNMSASACWRRVKALESAGLIESYRAHLNPEACGFGFHAMVYLTLASHRDSAVKLIWHQIQARPEILDCFATAGDTDLHLRIRCRDLNHYNEFLETFLAELDGVSNIRTNLILRQIKQGAPLDL